MISYAYSLLPPAVSLVLYLCLVVCPLRAQVCNTFPNPGFEAANSLLSWQGYDGIQAAPSGLTRSTDYPFSGAYSGKLSVMAPGATLSNVPAPLSMEAGQAYRLICWVRSSADSAQINLAVNRISNGSVLADTAWLARTQWYKMEIVFESAESLTQDIQFTLTAGAAADTNVYELFVDEVSICENDGLADYNLIGFPGFEAINYLDSWGSYDGGTPGSFSLLLTGDEVYDGQLSGRMKINYTVPNGAQIHTSRDPFTVDSLRYYTLRCRIKSSQDSVRLRTRIIRKSAYKVMAETYLELDTTWREFTWTFEADDTWNNDAYLQFWARNLWVPGTYDIYFDEVKLCEAGNLPPEAPGGVNQGLQVWLKANKGPDDDPLTDWEDQSGNDNHAVNANNGPAWQPEGLNGNPLVRFDGVTNGLAGSSLGLPSIPQNHSWYAVVRSDGGNPAGATAVSFGGNQSGYRLAVTGTGKWAIEGTTPGQNSLQADATDWSLIAVHASDSMFEAFVQGQAVISTGALTGVAGNNAYTLGAGDNTGNNLWAGDIAELLVYANSLATEQRMEIESYLAIKYGLSIPVTSHQYYAHNGHSNQVAGIGRDENIQGLLQAASQHIDPTSIVRVSRPTHLRDGDFLVWGHDGGSFMSSTNTPGSVPSRIQRTWRVTETGEVGKVSIHIDLRGQGLDFSQPYRWCLLIDNDGDFSDARIIRDPYVDGEQIGFPGVELADGEWFTVGLSTSGATPKAPGAIHEGIALWLTADQGPALNTGFRWLDRSPRKNDALAGGIGPRIESQVLNGNPVVRFDDNGDWLNGAGSLDLPADDHSWYMVTKTNDITNWRNPIALRSGGYRLEVRGSQHTWSVYSSNPNSLNSDFAVDEWHLLNVTADPATTILYADGNIAHARDERTYLQGEGSYILGARTPTGGSWWDGDIAEVIAYTQAHGTAARRAVQSYISVKFGIPIPVADHLYYDHADFPHNLAGIGRDLNAQALFQSSGRSAVENSRIQISNPTQLGEEEYLVWGQNGDSLSLDTNTPAGYPFRIARTWRVQETGEVGTVSISFYLSGLGIDMSNPGFFALMVDSDGDFSNAATYPNPTITGQTLQFDNIALNDGDYLSLAIPEGTTDLDPDLSLNALRMTLIPNPLRASETLRIRLEADQSQWLELRVFDVQGRLIQQKRIHHMGMPDEVNLSTSGWAAGMYLITLTGEKGTISQKLWLR